MTARRLVITRPAAQAGPFVAALRRHGVDAAALPLIAIEPLADTAPLAAAWRRLADTALVMFVSANAVAQFVAARPAGVAPWPAPTRAASTGPGTSAALRRAGVPKAVVVEPPPDAPSFDSEALWSILEREPWAGRRVLIVRGEDGRDWLAERLRAAGAAVETIAAYRRLPPRLDTDQAALLDAALARPEAHAWHFSSSEAIAHLAALRPAATWSASLAAATHPRIAEAARRAGFGRVDLIAPAPDAAAAWMRGASGATPPSIQSAPD